MVGKKANLTVEVTTDHPLSPAGAAAVAAGRVISPASRYGPLSAPAKLACPSKTPSASHKAMMTNLIRQVAELKSQLSKERQEKESLTREINRLRTVETAYASLHTDFVKVRRCLERVLTMRAEDPQAQETLRYAESLVQPHSPLMLGGSGGAGAGSSGASVISNASNASGSVRARVPGSSRESRLLNSMGAYGPTGTSAMSLTVPSGSGGVLPSSSSSVSSSSRPNYYGQAIPPAPSSASGVAGGAPPSSNMMSSATTTSTSPPAPVISATTSSASAAAAACMSWADEVEAASPSNMVHIGRNPQDQFQMILTTPTASGGSHIIVATTPSSLTSPHAAQKPFVQPVTQQQQQQQQQSVVFGLSPPPASVLPPQPPQSEPMIMNGASNVPTPTPSIPAPTLGGDGLQNVPTSSSSSSSSTSSTSFFPPAPQPLTQMALGAIDNSRLVEPPRAFSDQSSQGSGSISRSNPGASYNWHPCTHDKVHWKHLRTKAAQRHMVCTVCGHKWRQPTVGRTNKPSAEGFSMATAAATVPLHHRHSISGPPTGFQSGLHLQIPHHQGPSGVTPITPSRRAFLQTHLLGSGSDSLRPATAERKAIAHALIHGTQHLSSNSGGGGGFGGGGVSLVSRGFGGLGNSSSPFPNNNNNMVGPNSAMGMMTHHHQTPPPPAQPMMLRSPPPPPVQSLAPQIVSSPPTANNMMWSGQGLQ